MGLDQNWGQIWTQQGQYPYVDYEFDNICKIYFFQIWNFPLSRGLTPEILWLVGG